MNTSIASVSKLQIYPVKSLDPVNVESVVMLERGALQGDRRFAFVDAKGNFVNGKRCAQIHALRSQFDLTTNVILLQKQGMEETATFRLKQDRADLEAWVTHCLGLQVHLVEDLDMGFPDDTESPGPTIVSTATLEEIASWFPELTVNEVRRRFRANIELAGVPAFWEDQLFGATGQNVHFQIGAVQFVGINPCQRCVVVTRDAQTGIADPDFQKQFVVQRRATLPDWVERSQFNHFFRLAVNTRVPASEAGKPIHIGDKVNIL